MKIFLSLCSILLLFFLTADKAFAIVDPRASVNNSFGIHIISPEDLEDAVHLVNSSEGEWGYVTLVVREDDRNRKKWQEIFDRMRELKLIPIIRLATKTADTGWAKPRQEDIEPWVNFLASLNWVVKNRYVVLFNEPNHAQEWGGEINPEEYTRIVRLFTEKLKEKSADFFILPAGFDVSATNGPQTMAAEKFWKAMAKEDPKVFSLFDGWTSHAYPNPNFSSLPHASGKTSIRSYRWEVSWLTRFGLKANLPIFITETGWTHREGKKLDLSTNSAQTVSKFFEQAFASVWTDPQIVAITPFVLNYPEPPFDHFSWKKEDGSFYSQYETVMALPKTKGLPEQVHDAIFIPPNLPDQLIVNSDYKLMVHLKNTGQSIWERDDFSLKVTGSMDTKVLLVGYVPKTSPFGQATVEIYLKTPKDIGEQTIRLEILYQGKAFGEVSENQITILPPPRLNLHANLWFKIHSSGNDFTLLIYDGGNLVKKITPVTLSDGVGTIEELHDVIPRKAYRFVLIKPYYLPRQTYAYLSSQTTTVSFKRLLPLDFNNDGAFTPADLIAVLRNPKPAISLLLP